MKTFEVITSEIELHYMSYIYKVEAKDSETAKAMVLKGDLICEESIGGEYDSITPEHIDALKSGEMPVIQIERCEQILSDKELRQAELIRRRAGLLDEVAEINAQLKDDGYSV